MSQPTSTGQKIQSLATFVARVNASDLAIFSFLGFKAKWDREDYKYIKILVTGVSNHICSDSRCCVPFDTRLLLFFSHVVFMLHVA